MKTSEERSTELETPPRFWQQYWRSRSDRHQRLLARIGAVGLQKERRGVGPDTAIEANLPKLQHLKHLFSTIESRCEPESALQEILPEVLLADVAEIAESLDLWPFPIFFFGPKATIYDPYWPQRFAVLEPAYEFAFDSLPTGMIADLERWSGNWNRWCGDEASAIRTGALIRPRLERRLSETAMQEPLDGVSPADCDLEPSTKVQGKGGRKNKAYTPEEKIIASLIEAGRYVGKPAELAREAKAFDEYEEPDVLLVQRIRNRINQRNSRSKLKGKR